jgi:mannose-6-phosphate isomerase-like protein (cupin superfamily)
MSGAEPERDLAGCVRAAEVVLPCAELGPTLSFFTDRLGFRLDAISPADDPSEAVVSGHGLRIRLERGGRGAPGALRLLCDRAALGGAVELVAPNGTRIELADADPPVAMPALAPSFTLARLAGGEAWSEGRAGMLYRDLLPGRQGGRFIASHIAIPAGGPVPDYVHFHAVRFQMIYCRRGWVRVVYEDQGPPFALEAGDCVLQPPRIRHRVLESSPGLEVIELTSPAHHDTAVDHELALPNGRVDPGREFGGQRFTWHRAAGAAWRPWRDGFEARDLGIAEATGGLAGARVARPRPGAAPAPPSSHDAELVFAFVLAGAAALECAGREPESLAAGDAFAVPAGLAYRLAQRTGDLEILEVTLPAAPALRAADS